MGNGERGTGNGERGTENGERRTENGKRKTENGKRKTENEERGTGIRNPKGKEGTGIETRSENNRHREAVTGNQMFSSLRSI